MSSYIRTSLKADTVNEIASKILALSPEIILPIFIYFINKHLLSINLINYLGLVLCCVLNSTNASHDEPQYALLYRILTGHLKTGNLITQCLSSAYGNRNRVSRVNYPLNEWASWKVIILSTGTFTSARTESALSVHSLCVCYQNTYEVS